MTSTLKDRWNRLMGSHKAAAVERHVVEESIDDKKADAAAGEHLGGINPERLPGDEETPQG